MNASVSFHVPLCLALVLHSVLFSQEKNVEPAADQQQWQQWVAELSSDKFQIRESATASLIAAGTPAIPLMLKASFHKDPEVSARAITVLQALSKSTATETFPLASYALRIIRETSSEEEALQAFDAVRSKLNAIPVPTIETLDFRTLVTSSGGTNVLVLSGRAVSEASMRQLVHPDFADLDVIEASGTKLTDEGLQHLGSLSITKLGLHSTSVSDKGMMHLKHLPLKELSLGFTKVTDKGLAALQSVPIESLMLAQTDLTDEGMQHLAKLPLKNLNLVWVRISDAGLHHLKDLKLERLSISSPKITDEGIESLKEMPLKSLLLGGTSISDDGLRHLTAMPLEILWLYDTKLTDKALQHLQRIETLDTLYIQGTEFSEDAAEELRKTVRHVHTGRKE